MPKAIIFDVDGTLIDSVTQHARAWRQAFADFGHEIPLGELQAQIGKGGDQLMPVFLTHAQILRQGPALERHRGRVFKRRYLRFVTGLACVPDLFRRLIADGTAIGLASSAKGDELVTYKSIAGITDLVDAETTSDDADKSKPYPDIFQAALSRLGDISPAEVLAVGDTPYDAEAAAKSGMRSIGLLTGGWSGLELRRAGRLAVYRDPADLLLRHDASPLAPRF